MTTLTVEKPAPAAWTTCANRDCRRPVEVRNAVAARYIAEGRPCYCDACRREMAEGKRRGF